MCPQEQYVITKTDVLIGIDLQNSFCSGGSLAIKDADKIIPLINQVANHFPHVILTQDWHPEGHISFASSHPGKEVFDTISLPYGKQTLWPDHCIQDTHGASFHPALRIPHAELILKKGFHKNIDSYSAFMENDRMTPTGLALYLRERGFKRIFLVGLALDYCVRYSAKDAKYYGFHTIIIEDACKAVASNSLREAQKDFIEWEIPCINSNYIL